MNFENSAANSKKILRHVGVVYIVIISIINYAGFLLASSGSMPISNAADFAIWIDYLNQHVSLFNALSVMTFAVPMIVCFSYILLCKEKDIIKRIINIPIIYALFGSLGWLISLLQETVTLLYLHINGVLDMKKIFLSSLFNMSQICLFISTFAFLVLDLIHRKVILPRLFPGGMVASFPGVIRISSGLLITIFYLSVGIFPVDYLFTTLYNSSLVYDFTIKPGVIIIAGIIVLFGIAMTISFADHYSSPLLKLKNATRKMAGADYNVSVDVVSSDDFGDLADNFNMMADSLKAKSTKILAIQDSIIRGMAVMVEQRDNSTGGHINRTSDCVKIFVDHLQEKENCDLTPSFCKAVIKAAPMHDLGKIAVDDAILRKPGKFTDEEYEIMKRHAAAGKVIVERVLSEVEDEEFKQVAVHVAHYHHEKWNGKGYPEGISGTDIPIEARIMALADVFDALVSKRCYKDKMTYDTAFEIIEKDLGAHFDPELGKIFLECRPQLEALYNSYDSDN